MPDYPPEALAAAERALLDAATDFGTDVIAGSPAAFARAALDAAAPFLAAAFPGAENEAAIRAGERERCACRLRSVSPLDFLTRHGLRPGGRAGAVLKAAAAEIEDAP